MSPRTSTADHLTQAERPLPPEQKAHPAGDTQKPTLYVVNVPDAVPESCVDSAERDRQASLELLHRLVMG